MYGGFEPISTTKTSGSRRRSPGETKGGRRFGGRACHPGSTRVEDDLHGGDHAGSDAVAENRQALCRARFCPEPAAIEPGVRWSQAIGTTTTASSDCRGDEDDRRAVRDDVAPPVPRVGPKPPFYGSMLVARQGRHVDRQSKGELVARSRGNNRNERDDASGDSERSDEWDRYDEDHR